MNPISKAALFLFAVWVPALAQDNFSICDVNHDHIVNVVDAKFMNNQALGGTSPANDLIADGAVNVVDVQSEIVAILYGCPFYSVTPRFAIVTVSLLNQAWIPSEIPSAGNLSVRTAFASPATLSNQAWIPADIPSPGNLTVNVAAAPPVSLTNQAWISADIPSAGQIGFVAGLMASVNNTATTTMSLAGLKILGGGFSTAPIDLASVADGDALLAGQTIRFRVYPPGGMPEGSDFLVNGQPMRSDTPLEMLLTVPAHASGFDLQAVIDSPGGQAWRTPVKHLTIVPDPGRTIAGRAVHTGGNPAAATAVGVRTSGLTAEYFSAGRDFASWSDLNRTPDKRGFVTAVNQPDSAALGPDPFGTGLPGNYATRFRGEIAVAADGQHKFFLNAPQGGRLILDGKAAIDTPPAVFSPESQATVTLTAGWHTIEIDSYQPAFHPGLQLSWQQPDAGREIVRPEALATELAPAAVTGADGAFRVALFPYIINPLDWHSIPVDRAVRVVLDPSIPQERTIQK